MFPQWRKKYQNQLFIHFNVARYLNNLLSMIVVKDFAGDDYDRFHSYEPINFLVCIMMPTVQVAASLWTLIFTKHLYDTFVVVIYVKEDHKMLKQIFLDLDDDHTAGTLHNGDVGDNSGDLPEHSTVAAV
ncbi:hypothetical protein EVAR_28743_1 [Eumeta japonica]|uniref:Uncharacterized protein n=1 Tax=Eumeta variegata TaxID=151549 RepID=A0A4C1Z3M9_EUMVA|nr:hypothetical protein EVAR_28743_1 [Eumeta japonica]